MTGKTPAPAKYRLMGPLISLATLFLCAISLESAGYIWESRTAQGPLGWTLVGARRIRLERFGSADAPYSKVKANDSYNWGGIPVQINSKGFRGPEFSAEKPAGVYRILNIGDSVAFGWGVREEDTYGSKLQQLLNQRHDGRKYEVINLGVPTLNPEAERNLLLQEGLQYKPDLVILEITLVNDIYGSGPKVSEKQSLFQWLRDHTYAWPFLTNNIRFLLARRVGPEAIPVLNPPTEEDKYWPLDQNSRIYDEIFGFIKEMNDATHDVNADFMLVLFPTAFQLNSYHHSNIPQLALSERAKAVGIPYIDLLPIYKETCEKVDPKECEGYQNLLFADVWMHPSRLGHLLAAQQLAGAIK